MPYLALTQHLRVCRRLNPFRRIAVPTLLAFFGLFASVTKAAADDVQEFANKIDRQIAARWSSD